MRGGVGVTCVLRYHEVIALLKRRVARLNIIDASLDSLFLSFATRSEAFLRQVQNLAHGAIQANVSASKSEGVLVPLPTLPEQRAIASILRAIQEAKESRHRELAL